VDAARGAFWSGIVESVLCLGAFCFRYLEFLQYRVGGFAEDLIHHSAEDAMGAVSVQFGSGMVSLGEYLIQPLSMALVYFSIEGTVRFVAATIQGEVVPTMPLQLVAWAHQGVARRRYETWLGEKVPDEVLRGSGQDFEYRVASCRPKPWTPSTTISYEEGLFEVFKQEQGEPPRRFIYLLKKAPAHKVVRGLHNYDPEEVLRP